MALISDINTLWLTHADTVIYWIDSTGKEITPKSGTFRGVKFTTEIDEDGVETPKADIITDNGTITVDRVVEDKADIVTKIDEYLATMRASIVKDIPDTK